MGVVGCCACCQTWSCRCSGSLGSPTSPCHLRVLALSAVAIVRIVIERYATCLTCTVSEESKILPACGKVETIGEGRSVSAKYYTVIAVYHTVTIDILIAEITGAECATESLTHATVVNLFLSLVETFTDISHSHAEGLSYRCEIWLSRHFVTLCRLIGVIKT